MPSPTPLRSLAQAFTVPASSARPSEMNQSPALLQLFLRPTPLLAGIYGQLGMPQYRHVVAPASEQACKKKAAPHLSCGAAGLNHLSIIDRIALGTSVSSCPDSCTRR